MNAKVLNAKPSKQNLKNFRWLAGRSAEFQKKFLELGQVKNFQAGEYLYRRNHTTNQVFGLIEGQVDVHIYAQKNEDLTIPFTAPSMWFGLADMITQEPAFGTAMFGAPSLAVCISLKEMKAFLDEDPSRYQDILIHEYNLRRLVQQNVADLATSNGIELVARRILRMVEYDGIDGANGLSISQYEFAAATGVSAPTAQRP